jgi:phage-related tail fiber protein
MGNSNRNFYVWINGADRLNIGTTGNVGIGTSNPLWPLHIPNGIASFEKGIAIKSTNILTSGIQTRATLQLGNWLGSSPNPDLTALAIKAVSTSTQHAISVESSTSSTCIFSVDGSGKTTTVGDMAVGGNATVTGNLNVTGAISTSTLTGMVAYFAKSTAPAGWLLCNGAAVSRTTYSNLFVAIGTLWGTGNGSTTFNVPDMRGEFARGWDNGRGIDSGRSFASAQGAAMVNHTHSGTTSAMSANASHQHGARFGYAVGWSGGGPILNALQPTNNSTNDTGNGTLQQNINHTHTLTTGNPSTGGGTETRPRNIALLACINY